MAALKNNTDRRQVFQLPHDQVCTEDQCYCTVTDQRRRVHDTQTGSIGIRAEEVRVPATLVLPARGTSEDLPEEVLNLPSIADAVKRGLLTVA